MKRGRWRVSAGIALALAVVSGCAANHPDASGTGERTGVIWLSGIVTFRERKTLPRDAMIRVELMDVSGKDGPSRTIAMLEIAPEGRQPPIPFEISYNPAIIDPDRAYALRVKIFQGRRILFVNASANNVITNGVRSNVEVVVESVIGSDGGSR